MKVLVVEDSVFVREILVQACRDVGHQVIGEAATGAEAENLAQNLKPDLIIIDLVLPMKNGVEVIENLRLQGQSSFIVAISSLDPQFGELRALAAGANAFLQKPFTRDDLLSVLRQNFSGERKLDHG